MSYHNKVFASALSLCRQSTMQSQHWMLFERVFAEFAGFRRFHRSLQGCRGFFEGKGSLSQGESGFTKPLGIGI